MSQLIPRRAILGAAVGFAAAPYVRSRQPQEPRDKVRLAIIGLANRGESNWSPLANEEIVALCDVDPKHAEKARARFPKAKFVTDLRKLFDEDKAFDAVVVSTPDHTHAWPTMRALTLGKHVYCEKPLARTVGEVRAIRKAAAASRSVTQLGTQIHAGDNYRRVVEIVRSGALGPIRDVYVWLKNGPPAGKKLAGATPSAKLDLDLWQGSVTDAFFAAEHPSSSYKDQPWPHHHWRHWWEYGNGQLGDFGCHFLDLPFWALGLTTPLRVTASGTPIPNADNPVPGTMSVRWSFGGTVPVNLHWEHGVAGPSVAGQRRAFDGFTNGVLFVGADRYLVADYSKLRLYPKAFADEFKRPTPSIAKSAGHHKEWADAIRGNDTALCDFGYACNLTETVLLGNAAYRTAPGAELTWDAQKGWLVGHPEADDLLYQPSRKGWELPG